MNGGEEKIPNLDFLGTGRFFPVISIFPVISTAFSCDLRTLGASAREEFDPFAAAAAASHKSSNACAKKAVLVVELPPSGEEITEEGGVAEINQIEELRLRTGRAGGWGR